MRITTGWLVALLLLVGSAHAETPGGIAVLEFELNDLTLDPGNKAEVERTASLKGMLEKALSDAGHPITNVPPAAQRGADEGVGYLFDHADEAARLGRTVGARWLIVGRVHKASFLFVYFKAHVVDVATGEQVADLVVEVKGPQKALTARGVDSLAEQIEVVVDKASAP